MTKKYTFIILYTKMEKNENISEKERERRRKISEARKKAIEEKRRKGYRAFVAKRRREKKKAETIKRREEEKKKKKLERQKERERKKNLKKHGRKKLRGRKKIRYRKVKEKKTNALPEVKFKIISCRNGIQNKFIGGYRTSSEAYEEFKKLRKLDENVVFPAMYTGTRYTKNVIDEYVLIEKTEREHAGLRNEYGKIVEQKVNVEGWKVVDKFRYKKEETFWVWGYDNKKERKEFTWIYENVVLNGITDMDFKRVMIYKNKLLIKDDNGYLDLIICKNESDCARFYNKLEEVVRKDKVRQVIFVGDACSTLKKKRAIEAEIMEFTGWNEKKTKMNSTTK